MKRIRVIARSCWLALLAVSAALLCGCGTVEGDARNTSERPWNNQRAWETGLPSTINEGR